MSFESRHIIDLYSKGFTVVRSALSADTCENVLEKLRMQQPAHAHSDLAWSIRSDARILSIFEKAWFTDDLICSFDNISVSTEHAPPLSWHVDQDGSHIDTCVCLQGVLALTGSDVTELAVGSHNAHRNLCRDARRMHWQYVRLTRAQLHGFATERPQLEAGDLLIWDSRTAHRVARQAAGSMRAVMYLSYVPRVFATSSSLRERRSFFNKGVCTTHWPHRTVDRGEERIPPSQGYTKAAESARRLIDGDSLKGTKVS